MFRGRKSNEFELLCTHFGHVAFELQSIQYVLLVTVGIFGWIYRTKPVSAGTAAPARAEILFGSVNPLESTRGYQR